MDIEEELKQAKRELSKWKSEVTRLEWEIARSTQGRFPRLAHIRQGKVYIVVGRVELPAPSDRVIWPGYEMDLRTKKVKRSKTGMFLFWEDDPKDAEPRWLSDDEEAEMVRQHPRTRWAKEITARNGG